MKHLVRDFLDLHTAVCCIQESKLAVVDKNIWKSIGGTILDEFCSIPTQRSTGRMIIGWNESMFIRSLIHSNSLCLIIELKIILDQINWLCTLFYGPVARAHKADF